MIEKMAGDGRLSRIQHHHAHAAACMAENSRELSASPVLAIVMDGLGYGASESQSGEWWGGEFLLSDYYAAERLAALNPVAMPGGEVALREPWRNLLAQIESNIGWQEFSTRWPTLTALTGLQQRPVKQILGILEAGTNSPLASSAGRLFDAVACALGLPQNQPINGRLSFEGEAAMQLEALAERCDQPVSAYKFNIEPGSLAKLSPAPMWTALFDDLSAGRDKSDIAYAFHAGFAKAMLAMTQQLFEQDNAWTEATVVLSGGVFQNALLSRLLTAGLVSAGFQVLEHQQYPANDGGLSLGQAVIAAAQAIQNQSIEPHNGRTH
jgi:hydrogenase maturation protein HypF